MSVAGILNGHEFFHNLGMEEVNEVNEFSERRGLHKDEIIYAQDQRADKVYLLLEGTVLLSIPPKGNDSRIVVARVKKGELFGISSLLGEEGYTADALCEENAEVLVIQAKRLQQIRREDYIQGFVIMNEVARAYFQRYMELIKGLRGIVCVTS